MSHAAQTPSFFRRSPFPAAELDTPLTGTRALIRLNLRLDRLRILIWALAVGLGVWSSVLALQEAFPTEESLQARAALLGNPATIMMTGPAFALDDYTFGAAVANELSLYVVLAVAIMSVLLAVRHTRADEESGRLELLRAHPVGRFAPATASVVTVAVANLLVGAATTMGLLVAEMETQSSLAFGAATTATGLVFAALTTVFAQLTENARGVTGAGMAAVAIAYLVRGVGDVIDNQGSWLSWFSPFAWAQQTRLFVDLRWWPLLVALGVTVLLYALAMAFAQRRDLGAGLRPARRGPATAARALLSPAGVAQRLLRGGLVAWSIGAFFFAVAMGALATELDSFLAENPAFGDWVALGGTDLTTEFAGLILTYVLIAPLIVAVSGVLRLGAEEQSGRTEQVLASGVTRTTYLGGWITTVAAQTVVLTVLCGLGVGIGVGAATGDAALIGDLVVAAVVFLPALLLLGALAVALHGMLPRLTGIAWLAVVWVALVLFLGELLGLPGWAMDLSPFTHTPVLPGADPEAAPLLIMSGIAAALVVLGLVGFRRRDLATR